MTSINETIISYENIFRDMLKVQNPALLKTGALGSLINIFSNIKYDTAIYYNKLLREMNPATATEFSSLLFHSSLLNYNITFGIPSIMPISFLIPEFQLRPTEIITYTISKDTSFIDSKGLNYTLEEEIEIYVNNTILTAKRISDDAIIDLEVIKIKNPLDNNLNMYMVEFPDLKQYSRKFNIFNIPDYEIGENYSFSVDISALEDIYEINAWIRKESFSKEDIEIDKLYKINTKNINETSNLKSMSIKYNKFNANQFDDNLYLKILENQLLFTVGDGLNGQKLSTGDQIIIETKLTKGTQGNSTSAEINLENIIVVSEDEGGYTTSNKTNLKVISLSGGESGQDLADIEYIKNEMIKKSSMRNGISSINDFEIVYTLDNGKPFVDPKFFNSQNHLFIYNIIRDNNQKIVPTNTFNIKEDIFKKNLFMPTKIYEGIELISPFYYKKSYNHYTAYMIDPEIKISLRTLSSVDKLLKLRNGIGITLTYDYFERKSRIELKSYNSLYTYKIKTNLFDMELNSFNNFKQIINQRFLDEYCLLETSLEIISIDIYQDNLFIMQYQGDNKYKQLIKKQDNFYYTELDRLDTTNETRYVLQLPYLSIDYLKTTNIKFLFNKLDNFFRVNKYKNEISFNVGVTQSFYNTIKIDDKYRDFIIDKNVNGSLLTTRNLIIIDIIIDKHQYSISNYKSTDELEFDLKNRIYTTLREAEGFETEFYETLLEKNISNEFKLIKNIDVISPKVFTSNDTNTIYSKMDDALNASEISLFEVVDFVPPYFFFDYDSISLNTTII